MKIGIIKETTKGETRVAITPDIVEKLIKLGFTVDVAKDAGVMANFNDNDYVKCGAKIISNDDIYNNSDILITLNPPSDGELSKIKDGATLISMIWPAQNEKLLKKMSAKKINVIAMDCVPRISRSQKMDVLSSMANIGGYRAIVEATNVFGRFLGGQITAAGKINPAKVLVIGAGVAGLSAIGAASSLGAIVRAFDTRPEAKEQVESMHAEFLEVDIKEDGSSDSGYAKTMSKEFIEAEMALFLEQAKEVDIIVTTALIPGKPSPKLITEDMVKAMATGSVIVDLAAQNGGNCELTQKDKVVQAHGVHIIGYSNLPTKLPQQASKLYASNICHLINDLSPKKDGQINLNFDDEVIRGVTVIKNGEITWPAPAVKVSSTPKSQPKVKEVKQNKQQENKSSLLSSITMMLFAIGAIYWGNIIPEAFLSHLIVFVLSCFIGYQVIWSVTPALHTPLMSVTNAISGIIVIGGLVQITNDNYLSTIIATIAIFIATINIVGGFATTQKTLKMFSK